MAKKPKDDEEPQEDLSDGTVAVNDAWTGLLAISLLALVIGTGFLVYDWSQYDEVKAIPKLSSQPPPDPGKIAAPPEKKADDKKADDKDKDKAKEKDKG